MKGKDLVLPISLPDNWIWEVWMDCIAITARNSSGKKLGTVTVSEPTRTFSPGFDSLQRLPCKCSYTGRGWKVQLYSDAVESLRKTFVGELSG